MSRREKHIYVIAMYCLDDTGETYRQARSKSVRARYGHENLCEGNCLVCYRRIESRTVGWYETFEFAEKVVLESAPWDHLYSHAVIEKVPTGIHALGSKVMQWYRLIREEGKSEQECKVEKIPQPDSYKNIVNLTMG